MSRNVENPHRHSRNLAGLGLVDQTIRGERLNLQFKAMASKKPGIRDHRLCFRVEGNPAAVAALDLGDISRVVEVPVGEDHPVEFLPGKVLVGSLRRVKKDVPSRRLQKKCVCIEWTAGKDFELIHSGVV